MYNRHWFERMQKIIRWNVVCLWFSVFGTYAMKNGLTGGFFETSPRGLFFIFWRNVCQAAMPCNFCLVFCSAWVAAFHSMADACLVVWANQGNYALFFKSNFSYHHTWLSTCTFYEYWHKLNFNLLFMKVVNFHNQLLMSSRSSWTLPFTPTIAFLL